MFTIDTEKHEMVDKRVWARHTCPNCKSRAKQEVKNTQSTDDMFMNNKHCFAEILCHKCWMQYHTFLPLEFHTK